MKKSNIELAFDIISKEPQKFKDLWEKIVKTQGLTQEEADEKVSKFYTSLSFDGRFVMISDRWDLKEKHKENEWKHPGDDSQDDDLVVEDIESIEEDDSELNESKKDSFEE